MDTASLNTVRGGLAAIGHRLRIGLAVALGVTVWAGVGTTMASADEFTVGIVVDSSMSERTDSTFMDGFQLAVDQSPDVGHPANIEGGDHLGSMDVVMVVVDGTSEPADLVAAAIELIEIDRLPIVVVDLTPCTLASLVGRVTGSGTMLISMSESPGLVFDPMVFFFNAAVQDGIESLLIDRAPVFESAFVGQYGRPSSAASARGYLAGRLVDLAVEATDRDPSDTSTIAVALAGVDGTVPTSSDVAGADATVSEAISLPTGEAASPTASKTQVVEAEPLDAQGRSGDAVLVVAAAVMATSVWMARRRRSRPEA